MSPQNGSKSFVALVPKRRSGRRLQRKPKSHQIKEDGVGEEVHNLQEGVPRPVASRRLNPDEALAAARAPVCRLEAALGVFAECDSTETRTLRDSLQHARRSAQEQPFTAQIKDTEDFIARSMKRIKEEQLLESATRLARLRQMVSSVPPPTELDAQVAEVKAKLAVAEAERDARAKEGPGRTRRSFNGRQWCRHSHAGSRPEAGTSWGSSFHIATRGTPEGFARGCCFRQTHRSRESLRVHDQSSPGMAADDTRAIPFRAKRGCQHGEVTHSIHCSGRWGLRWIRVGQASNPCSTASAR